MPTETRPTYRRPSILLMAVLSGLLVGACGFFVDFLVHNTQRLYASDFYTVIVASLFSYALLIYQARTRAVLLRRMEIAAEVNHHIRNALTAVVYTAAVQGDPELEAVIQDATTRIDWVLSTVLPDGASELEWPIQAKSWKPSPWRKESLPKRNYPGPLVPPKAGSSAKDSYTSHT